MKYVLQSIVTSDIAKVQETYCLFKHENSCFWMPKDVFYCHETIYLYFL